MHTSFSGWEFYTHARAYASAHNANIMHDVFSIYSYDYPHRTDNNISKEERQQRELPQVLCFYV